MAETEDQRAYREDARTLGEIGAVLVKAQLPRTEVRIPRPLAQAAMEAWERDDGEGEPGAETTEQRLLRHRAGYLGLLGLAISERGRVDGNVVVVELDPVLIGIAVDAADDLLDGEETW
jgi:hypothetical protein